MKLFVVEGNSQRLDGGAMFGNAPKMLWQNWIPADEQNRIALACRALLVQTEEGKNFLFETGVGAFFEPKLKERYGVVENEHVLLKNLASLGLDHTDIHGVILSHLHFDHAGGLLTPFGVSPPSLLFPNAYYYVGKDHWTRALQPHFREKASFISFLPDLLKQSNRLKFIEGSAHSDLKFAKFRFSNGHTMGLMISEISLPAGPLLFVSDLIPGIPWIHLPVTMGYDRYPELLVDEKKALYEDLEGKEPLLFFTHDPHHAFAYLRKEANGKYYGEPKHMTV